MLQKQQDRKNEILLSALLAFYVIWKMPVVALHTNTILAMLLLVLLAVLCLRNNEFLNHAPVIFAAAILFFLLTIIDERQSESNWFYVLWRGFLAFLPLALGVLLIYYKKDRQIKILVPVVLVVYAITCITTYIGLQKFPTASRELATGSVNYTPYYQRNIGGFTFIYSLVVLHPMFVCVLWRRNKRLLSIVLSVLIGICVFESRYTAGALTFIISCVSYVLPTDMGRKKKTARFALIFLALIIAYTLAPSILRELAKLKVLEASSEKIIGIADILQGKSSDVDGLQARQRAYERSWEGFLKSPVFGNEIVRNSYYYNGNHSYILDMMAKWGLIGLSVIIFVLRAIYRYYKQLTGGTTVFYPVMLSYLLAILLAFLNSAFWYYELGFIVPIFAYYALMYTKKPENETPVADSEEPLS